MVTFVTVFSAEEYSGLLTIEIGVGVVFFGSIREVLREKINSVLKDMDSRYRTSI